MSGLQEPSGEIFAAKVPLTTLCPPSLTHCSCPPRDPDPGFSLSFRRETAPLHSYMVDPNFISSKDLQGARQKEKVPPRTRQENGQK